MGRDYGTPVKYDPNFQGPIHNRSCTDIFWLIVFILFLGVWGFLGYYSFKDGKIDNLLAPIDSQGKRCGLDAGLQDKKYLVFFDITKCLNVGTPIVGCPTPQVCVESCPSKTRTFWIEGPGGIGGTGELTTTNFQELKKEMVCNPSVNMATMDYYTAIENIKNGLCASYVLQSKPVLFRCIGDLSALQCKESGRGAAVSARAGDSCVRDAKGAQESLLTRTTVLDSYVGWTVASWVTFFTTNASERDTHIRCVADFAAAAREMEEVFKLVTNQTAQEVITEFAKVIQVQELSSRIVEDLVKSRWYMAGALVAVVLICFLYILLLRWVVSPVVWTSIVGLLALLGYCLYLCYLQYQYYRDHPVTLHQTNNLKGYAESWFTQSSTWMVIMIALAVVILVLLLIIIFLRGRIVIAIALIREGSRAVTAIKTTVFFPIFPWLLQCGLIAYAVLIFMYLLSMGDPMFRVVNLTNDTECQCTGLAEGDVCNATTFQSMCHYINDISRPCKLATCHFVGMDSYGYVMYLHLLNLLGFFWTMFFVSGIADMMLASTFSTWYWTFHKKNLPFFTLTGGIARTLRYHLGTVALGSLIIAIVRVIRVILEYVDHKLKKFDNPFTRCILCCCKCFFWCLENFLKFINKNAYIMCAVHGKNFCTSARDAFSLLMRNIVRVVVLDKVTDFIFFLSKLLISIGVGVAVYYLMKWKFVFEITQGEQLNYSYIPAIILSIATYLICTIFFNVYSMAVDTLFLCFLEDCERNDGSAEKPFFMSKNLMKILGKTNKRD